MDDGKRRILRFSAAGILILFAVVTLWVTFAGSFESGLRGYVVSPSVAYSGSAYSFVMALRDSSGRPVSGASASVSFMDSSGKLIGKHESSSDRFGLLSLSQEIPSYARDFVSCRVFARSKVGGLSFGAVFKVVEGVDVVFVTDKRIYAPGDSVFVKCASYGPHRKREVLLTLFDPSGNSLCVSRAVMSEYGFASLSVPLGRALSPGTYMLRVDSEGSAYSRPLEIGTADENALQVNASMSPPYFVQGRRNRISVSVENRFGIRVQGAYVSAQVSEVSGESSMSEKRYSGDTDSSGKFVFEYTPSSYDREFLADNDVDIVVKASVKLSGGEFSESSSVYRLSREPFSVSFRPEASSLTPGMRNRVFLLTSHPDGSPAVTRTEAVFGREKLSLSSNACGLTEFYTDPASEGGVVPTFTVTDSEGSSVTVPFDSSKYMSSGSFSISAKTQGVKAGGSLDLKVTSVSSSEPVSLFLVSEGRIAASKTVEIKGRETPVSFGIPENVDGLCSLCAMRVGLEKDFKSIPVYVVEGNEITLRMSLAKNDIYPGEQNEVLFDSDSDDEDENFKGVVAAKIISGDYGYLREIIDAIMHGAEQIDMTGFLDTLGDSTDLGSPKVVDFFRAVLSRMPQDPGLSLEDVSGRIAADSAAMRTAYYKGVFSWLAKICLIVMIVCFLVILCWAVRAAWLESVGRSPADNAFDSGEMAGVVLFNSGIPMTAFVTAFISMCVMSIRHVSVNDFVSSKMLLVTAGICVSLLFVYELAMAHVLHFYALKGLNLAFRRILNVFFVYIAAVIAAGALILTASCNLWGIWGYETLLSGNRRFFEIAFITLLVMPFVTLSITFLRLGRAENNKYYRPVFLVSSVIVASILSFFFVAGYSRLMRSDRLPAFLSDRGNAAAAEDDGLVAKPLGKRPEPQIDFISSFSVPLDSWGKGSRVFRMPDASGRMTIRAIAFTNKGVSDPCDLSFNLSRPCMLTLVGPSAMTVGDRLVLPLRVKNCSDRPSVVRLSVRGEGAVKTGAVSESVRLRPYEEICRNVGMEAASPGQGVVRAEVSCGRYSEKREVSAVVSPPYPKDVRMAGGRFFGPVSQKMRFSEKELRDLESLSVTVCPGILSNYEICAGAYSETPSATGANCAAYARILAGMMRFVPEDRRESFLSLKDEASRSVQDLMAYRNEDGSFSLLKGGPPDVWLTASAVESLFLAGRVVFTDEDAVMSAVEWLKVKQQKNGSWENNPRLTAKVLHSLSRAGMPRNDGIRRAEEFLRRRILASRDPFALAYSALYFERIDRDFAGRITALINKNALHTHGMCCWNSLEGLYSCLPGKAEDVQATALCLRVLIRTKGYEDVSKRAVDYLMQERTPDGAWRSRESSAEVLDTLESVFGSVPADFAKFGVSVNGREFQSAYGKGRDKFLSFRVDPGSVLPESEIKVKSPEGVSGTFFISASFKGRVQNSEALSGVEVRSFSNKRSVSAGDSLRVGVTVSNRGNAELRNIVLSLPDLPGFTVLGKSFGRERNVAGYHLGKTENMIFIGRIEPGGKFTKTVSLKAAGKCRVSLPPASAFSLTNPLDRVYGNRLDLSCAD